MIARMWHGVMPAKKADEYVHYLNRAGVPDYQVTTGNRGVYVMHRIEGDRAHFVTLSLWDSLDAIQGFAGADLERARYHPEGVEFLIEFEPTVTHYEVVIESG